MARLPRADAPGTAHHVMLRGIERRAIFTDDIDRADFLRRLSRLVPELGFRCFAWALMPNHVHLALRSGPVRISRLMARLGTGYARRFNERHGRVGHLFQNRFRSRRIVDEADLLGVVLYVTRNPLEAGLVAGARELERFPWCGLGALAGRAAPHPFEAVGETLALFDRETARARRRLRSWLDAGAPLPEEAMRLPEEIHPRREPAPAASDFEALVREVCDELEILPELLRSRRRTRPVASARERLAARAAAELGLSGAEIGRRLGVTKSGVHRMLGRAQARPETS